MRSICIRGYVKCVLIVCCFRHKTAYEMRISDWSSDVCSSDLFDVRAVHVAQADLEVETPGFEARRVQDALVVDPGDPLEIVVLAVVPAADHTLVVDLEHQDHAAVVARHRYRDVLPPGRKQHAIEFGDLKEILDRHSPCRGDPGKAQARERTPEQHWPQ